VKYIVSEFSGIVSELKVSRGEIKADGAVVKTTDKKILVNVGDKPVSVAPTAKGVIIKDENFEVDVFTELSLDGGELRIGSSQVKLAPSVVAKNLGVAPQAIELKEENTKAVYKLKVNETRNLFGFIPLRLTKTLTTDAQSSDILDERLPWYSFLTTR